MTRKEAYSRALSSPWVRGCALLSLVCLIVGVLALTVFKTEIEPAKPQAPLWNPKGIYYGPYHLKPGRYQLVIDPLYSGGHSARIMLQREAGGGVLSEHVELEDYKKVKRAFSVSRPGPHEIRLEMPSYGGGYGMIRGHIYRYSVPGWPFFPVSVLLGLVAYRLLRVQVKVLRRESL